MIMSPLCIPFSAIAALRALMMSDQQIAAVVDALDIRAIVSGAVENASIKRFQMDPRYSAMYANIENWPPMRVEFETAIVFGHIGESVALAKSKSWGKVCLGVHPLEPDDELDPQRIVYILKSTNKMRQRWEWRNNLKRILGRDRALVNDAMRFGKNAFITQLKPGDEKLLFSKLELSSSDFWGACRYGERAGEYGFAAYYSRLQERTKGYTFDFVEVQP